MDALEDRLETKTGSEPTVVGMGRYQLLSELIFYNPDQEEAVRNGAGSHLFGQRSLMFEEWTSRESVAGKNILLVSLDAKDLGAKAADRFHKLGPALEVTIHYRGKTVRPLYYRVGYGYFSDR